MHFMPCQVKKLHFYKGQYILNEGTCEACPIADSCVSVQVKGPQLAASHMIRGFWREFLDLTWKPQSDVTETGEPVCICLLIITGTDHDTQLLKQTLDFWSSPLLYTLNKHTIIIHLQSKQHLTFSSWEEFWEMWSGAALECRGEGSSSSTSSRTTIHTRLMRSDRMPASPTHTHTREPLSQKTPLVIPYGRSVRDVQLRCH